MATFPARHSTVLALLGLVLVPAGLGSLGGCAPAPPAGAAPEVALPPPGDGVFTDVTLPAGIRTRHRLPTPDLYNIVDALGAGAAFADLNGDDLLDLVTLGGPRSPEARTEEDAPSEIRLFRNLGNGRFGDVTGASGIPGEVTAVAVAVADVDGDGDRDVYLVDRGPNRLFRNRGDGVFEDVTRKAGVGDSRFGVGAVFLDVDLDGDLDLYVANYLEYDERQTAHFAPDGYPGPLTYRPQSDVLYLNRGDGTFVDGSAAGGLSDLRGRGMSLAAADFDEDGDTDVFVANDATGNFLLLNDGEGRFSERGLVAGVAMGQNGEQTAAMAADVGDVDGDGYQDLAVSDTSYGALYRRVGPGLFEDTVMRSGIGRITGQYVSWGQNLIDYDNDADLDLFVVNGGLHHLVGWEALLLRNTGNGRFEDASGEGGEYFSTRPVGRGSIYGDYDNDGDIDLFVTTLGGAHTLLRNDTDNGASWITFDLIGPGVRDVFGAVVELHLKDKKLVAESRCASGYLGQSDPRLHFGLGRGVETIDRVVIRWPGGREQILEQVAARQILRVEMEAL